MHPNQFWQQQYYLKYHKADLVGLRIEASGGQGGLELCVTGISYLKEKLVQWFLYPQGLELGKHFKPTTQMHHL